LPEEKKGRTLPSTYYTESKGKGIQIYWIISKILGKLLYIYRVYLNHGDVDRNGSHHTRGS